MLFSDDFLNRLSSSKSNSIYSQPPQRKKRFINKSNYHHHPHLLTHPYHHNSCQNCENRHQYQKILKQLYNMRPRSITELNHCIQLRVDWSLPLIFHLRVADVYHYEVSITYN